MPPLRIRMTRSAICAMAALWVMMTVVAPSDRFTPSSASRTTTPGFEVEGAGGLIAEKHVRPLGDRPGDRDRLLLTPGKLGRKMIEPFRHPDHCERGLGRHRAVGQFGNQLHVLTSREARNQVVELEHEPDGFAAEPSEFPIIVRREVVIEEPDPAGGREVEPAEDVEEGGFAASRWPQNHHQLAPVQLEIDLAEGGHFDVAEMKVFDSSLAENTGSVGGGAMVMTQSRLAGGKLA